MSRRNGTLSDRSGQVVLPLADAGWLAPLLDGGRVASILTDLARPGAPAIARCTLRHVRYRPGASCTVSYQVFPDGPGNNDPIAVYARTLAPGRGLPGAGGTPEPALRPTARLLDGPTPLPSLNTVLREFPLDATLPQLRHLADARRLGQLVSRGVGQHLGEIGELPVRFTTLRYKPEHRLVLRADWLGDDRPLATCQVRFEYGTDLPGRLSLVQQLARAVPTQGLLAAPGWEIHLPEPGCTVVEWQKGRDLARAVRKGDTDAASLTGQALAELGRIRIEGLPSRNPAAALDPLAQQVLVLQRHSPADGLARRFAAVMRALEDLQFSPRPGLVHGDYIRASCWPAARRSACWTGTGLTAGIRPATSAASWPSCSCWICLENLLPAPWPKPSARPSPPPAAVCPPRARNVSGWCWPWPSSPCARSGACGRTGLPGRRPSWTAATSC